MRGAVTDWMRRIGDQGLINEAEMIQRMWPSGVQPATAQPYIVPRRTPDVPERRSTIAAPAPMEVVIYVPTQGASIGYTTEDGPNARWRLYTGPILVTAYHAEAHGSADALNAVLAEVARIVAETA